MRVGSSSPLKNLIRIWTHFFSGFVFTIDFTACPCFFGCAARKGNRLTRAHLKEATFRGPQALAAAEYGLPAIRPAVGHDAPQPGVLLEGHHPFDCTAKRLESSHAKSRVHRNKSWIDNLISRNIAECHYYLMKSVHRIGSQR